MSVRLITFDCAQTLIDVKWRLGDFALQCSQHVGLDLDETAADLYRTMFLGRHREYLDLNLTRDPRLCEVFWVDLERDWLAELGQSDEWLPKIRAASRDLGFSPGSPIFSLYPDVVPCLDRLRASGVEIAVISNWDFTLHPVLKNAGIYDRFGLVVASLEEGFEKPDPRIFRLALDHFGVAPREALHVGDDPVDDLKGARDIGMRAALIDRSLKAPNPPYISSLSQLTEAMEWTA